MSQRESGTVDFSAAFLLGALFGAGVALLLAPKAGKDLRKDVSKRGQRIRKDAGKQFEKTAESLRESGTDWMEDTENRLGDLREEGVRSIREAAAEELQGIQKRLDRRKRGLFR
jgi:gas vesicle protein